MENIEIHCSLCSILINKTGFNLKSNNSKYSKTPLLTIIENITGKLVTIYYDICIQCYDLLNELDAIQLRHTEIQNQFRKYVANSKFITSSKEFLHNDVSEMSTLVCCDTVENNLAPKLDEISDLKMGEKFINPNTVDTGVDKCISNEDEEKTEKPGTKRTDKRKEHSSVQKPYKCNVCSKVFRTPGEVKNHMNSHSDYRAFICDICGQSYKHKAAFNIHMDMHNGINPFTCIYCNKSFTQKGALVRHVPIHTGEMPYQCDECGKRFVHHTSFNVHRLSHTGLKSFKCTLCGLALMSGSHLKRHMRIHTGEKKYVCETCGKRFAERYNLAVHEKLHANPGSSVSQRRSYNCQICGESFERKVRLEEHLVKEHQIMKSELDAKDVRVALGNGSLNG